MSLILHDLCKTYPTRGGELTVLRNINLTLQSGEALAIVGPSGSGKSTLLYLLGTLERATSGTYKLGDQEPFRLSDRELAHFRNRSIGFVFQDHHLLPQCSVLENVLIPTLAGPKENLEGRARELLERVGLSHRLDHRIRAGRASHERCPAPATFRRTPGSFRPISSSPASPSGYSLVRCSSTRPPSNTARRSAAGGDAGPALRGDESPSPDA